MCTSRLELAAIEPSSVCWQARRPSLSPCDENTRNCMPRKLTHSAAIDPLHEFPVSVQPLQPCPFCGGSEVWINSDIVPKFVACRKCWAFGPSAPTVTQAAERWNKRATPPWNEHGCSDLWLI